MPFDIYQAVTDRILDILERGTVSWRQPIRSAGSEGLPPMSMASKKPDRGINVFGGGDRQQAAARGMGGESQTCGADLEARGP